MKSNKLIILTIVTIVVIVAATMMSRHRAPTTSLHKQLLFPGLLEKVNVVSSLSLTKQEQSLTLSQIDKHWGIEQADNYPADFGKIRETVIAVAELRILAEKTSNTDLYERLGVEEPSHDGANSQLLSLRDVDGNALATLIVGNARHSKSPGDKSGLYVRLPDSQTTLLVEGRLDVSVDVTNWFKRELFSINANRVKRIHIAHVDGSVVKLDRSEDIGDFMMDNLPDDMEMQSNVIISRMGTMLEDIFVDNIMSADKLMEVDQTIATIHTFDGLIITIASAEINGHNYSSFNFTADENVSNAPEQTSEENATKDNDKPSPSEEAEGLNAIMSDWAYAVPSFKYELFTRKAEQLSRKIGSTDETASKTNAEAN